MVIENFKKKTFCKPCAAKYNREWREKNPPNDKQKLRNLIRVQTYRKIRNGKLIRMPCEVCGELKVEAHHDDYYKPFEVRWLCGHHHREHHMMQRRQDAANNKNDESINN